MGNSTETINREAYAAALYFLSKYKGIIQSEIGERIGKNRQHVTNFVTNRGGTYRPTYYAKLHTIYPDEMMEYEQAQDFFILEWQANIDPAWAAKQIIKLTEQVDDLEGDLARMQRRLEHEQELNANLAEMLKNSISKGKDGVEG